jgi:hypothetical protein
MENFKVSAEIKSIQALQGNCKILSEKEISKYAESRYRI